MSPWCYYYLQHHMILTKRRMAPMYKEDLYPSSCPLILLLIVMLITLFGCIIRVCLAVRRQKITVFSRKKMTALWYCLELCLCSGGGFTVSSLDYARMAWREVVVAAVYHQQSDYPPVCHNGWWSGWPSGCNIGWVNLHILPWSSPWRC